MLKIELLRILLVALPLLVIAGLVVLVCGLLSQRHRKRKARLRAAQSLEEARCHREAGNRALAIEAYSAAILDRLGDQSFVPEVVSELSGLFDDTEAIDLSPIVEISNTIYDPGASPEEEGLPGEDAFEAIERRHKTMIAEVRARLDDLPGNPPGS